jgi:hypothetical protein
MEKKKKTPDTYLNELNRIRDLEESDRPNIPHLE